jgi:redox-sensitive bicupin YhaK (pirin superfamily)
MITIRKKAERGATKTPWLESKHTFSFGSYYDLKHMNFGALRVINEDKVIPGKGFQAHSHKDMEIISYVLEGALEHKDSLGTGSIIVPGEVQLMRAGSGITHSEYNPSKNAPIHFLQIWIFPDHQGLEPSYQQKNFTKKRQSNHLTLVASKTGEDESLTISQDVKMYVLDLEEGKSFFYAFSLNRMVWVQVAKGRILLNGSMLNQGDGAAVSFEKSLDIIANETAEILIFDLAQE